mmetsp:Transcript_64377/g.153553  ORF Transcript_64377/g.153553 Transcript_64377/m.153553 type:complete len:298 (+) Transcript_64377:77-970(+)
MGERKVLNKYYPPDFDPELLPRNKKPKDRQIEVRIMIPFTLCCVTCKEFSYRGKKFNSKKEIASDVDYLGIAIHRFFIKCPRCASEIVFRTDPKNADYHMEHGATRNYEIWNDKRGEEDSQYAERESEEAGDAMMALENRTADSQIEMDILDALDDSKLLNARHQKVDTNKIIDKMREEHEKQKKETFELDEADEEALEKVEFGGSAKRIGEEEELRREKARQEVIAAAKAAASGAVQASGGKAAAEPARRPGVVLKRKADAPPVDAPAGKEAAPKEAAPTMAGLMGGYTDSGSSSD